MPHPRRTNGYDIVQEIVLSLDAERGLHGAGTTILKVYGAMGTRGKHCTQLMMQWQQREQTGKWKPMSNQKYPEGIWP
jgi:hypothetical protein